MSGKDSVRVLMTAVNTYDLDLGRRVLHPDYEQHNPFIPDKAEGLLSLFHAMQEAQLTVETLLLIEEGDNVAAFNRWHNSEIFGYGCNQMVAFDFFRVNADGALAGHWDAMMCEGAANASGRTVSGDVTEIEDLSKTDDNKRLIDNVVELLISGDAQAFANDLPLYFDSDFKQHSPDASDGIDGLLRALKGDGTNPAWQYSSLHKTIGEGNYVLAILEGEHKESHSVFYELFRLSAGKIAEHWSVRQNVPVEGLAHSNTMFNF